MAVFLSANITTSSLFCESLECVNVVNFLLTTDYIHFVLHLLQKYRFKKPL